jgi:hypothetical protein
MEARKCAGVDGSGLAETTLQRPHRTRSRFTAAKTSEWPCECGRQASAEDASARSRLTWRTEIRSDAFVQVPHRVRADHNQASGVHPSTCVAERQRARRMFSRFGGCRCCRGGGRRRSGRRR